MTTRAQRKQLERDNQKFPLHLVCVPESEWQFYRIPGLKSVWRSRAFLVLVVQQGEYTRLTVCRTAATTTSWRDRITWDDLQRLKRECGFADRCAVEIFPPDSEIVNVANMRHIFLVDAPPFMWSVQGTSKGTKEL